MSEQPELPPLEPQQPAAGDEPEAPESPEPAPDQPEVGHADLPPEVLQPPEPREKRDGIVRRRPWIFIVVTGLVALLLGMTVAAVVLPSQEELDTARQQAAAQSTRADKAEAALKKATAKAGVPSLLGLTVDEAEADDTVSSLSWKITSRREQSSKPSGTIIAQSPKEGAVLKSGRTISVTVATPRPRQWVTIKTLSGAGSTKTEEFTIPGGARARMLYSMPGDGNNAITLYAVPNEYVDLLLNEIGPQQGQTRIYESGTFYLDVSGSHTITIQVFKRP